MSEKRARAARFDPERVHVARYRDEETMRKWFRDALAALAKVKSKEVIAIKPNLGSPLPGATGATTALWMIEETVAYVRRRRGRPVIVEAPSHIHDYQQVLEVTGAGALFDRLGVEHADAREGTMALRPLKHDDAAGRVYEVAMAALSADGIINLPKLKTHNRTGVTLGIKGLMGLLSVPTRHGFHRRGVTDDIVELYKRLRERVRVTFIDGVIGMEGRGPSNGRPVRMDVIIAGKDTVSVDSLGALIMGFDPDAVDHLRIAHQLALGRKDRDWQMHPGDVPLPMHPFERARLDNGVRTQLITFPPFSAVLRAGRIGVRGRTKPVLESVPVCSECTICADVCPTAAIDPPKRLDYRACVGCGLCIPACPEDALLSEGGRHKLRRVLRELVRSGL